MLKLFLDFFNGSAHGVYPSTCIALPIDVPLLSSLLRRRPTPGGFPESRLSRHHGTSVAGGGLEVAHGLSLLRLDATDRPSAGALQPAVPRVPSVVVVRSEKQIGGSPGSKRVGKLDEVGWTIGFSRTGLARGSRLKCGSLGGSILFFFKSRCIFACCFYPDWNRSHCLFIET